MKIGWFEREKKTIAAMVEIYCRGHHGDRDGGVCEECDRLFHYAVGRLVKCPFGEEKGACSKCRVHCYEASMRKAVHEVMRYAGPKMMKKHPLLAIRHLLKNVKREK